MTSHVERLRALTARLTEPRPCPACDGDGWEDDQNWSPEDYERNRPRTEGHGLIRCGRCGGVGMILTDVPREYADALARHVVEVARRHHVEFDRPAASTCAHCGTVAPCPDVTSLLALADAFGVPA